jgi:predicted DNA-binding transcriptional regulator AlpA
LDYNPSDPLLNAKQSAAEVGLSIPGFWKGVAAERFPAPYYPAGRAPRWRLSELKAALEKTRALPREQKAKRRERRIAAERRDTKLASEKSAP